jgi:hypothetical protein
MANNGLTLAEADDIFQFARQWIRAMLEHIPNPQSEPHLIAATVALNTAHDALSGPGLPESTPMAWNSTFMRWVVDPQAIQAANALYAKQVGSQGSAPTGSGVGAANSETTLPPPPSANPAGLDTDTHMSTTQPPDEPLSSSNPDPMNAQRE